MNRNITYARVMFWLGALVFITAFTYVIVLGINNTLRYYYIQSIEDRLYVLIPSGPDDEGRGLMIHWNGYNAPIITRNIKHIASTHTALYYVCYTVTIISIVMFSMGMVASLFLRIEGRKWFDTWLVIVALVTMILVFFFFLRMSARAPEVAQFAFDMAHENQEIRLKNKKKEVYGKAKSFRRIFWYLFYPKKQDLQKPLLLMMGFAYGIFLSGIKFDVTDIGRLIFVLFAFDFLAYQARYQINDIRGIQEDKEEGKTNRLPLTEDINARHVIKISSLIALAKIMMALLLTVFFGKELKGLLLISLGILFISTVLYEAAKDMRCVKLIYFLVGCGYPLRFMLGLFSAMPKENWVINLQVICFIVALWAYGSFSSVLSWIDQVSRLMQGDRTKEYTKQHFNNLKELIASKYAEAEKRQKNSQIFPLREKCGVFELWNSIFIISLLGLMFTALFGGISKGLLCLEIIVCVVFSVYGCFEGKNKLRVIAFGWCGIVIKGTIAWFTLNNNVWYLLLSIMQVLITYTYFLLSYQPKMGMKIKLKRTFFETVLGKEATKILFERHC